MFRDLASDPLFVQELHEVVDYLRDRCSAPEKADNSVYQAWNPLPDFITFLRHHIAQIENQ